MEKYLSIIVSLLAISGHLQADSASPSYANYREFIESTKDAQQNALAMFDQLIPQEEKENWKVIYEDRSKYNAYLEWCTQNKQSIMIRCRGEFKHNLNASCFYQDDYVDDYGYSHNFSMPDDYQVIEEMTKEGSVKFICLTTVIPNFVFTIKVVPFHDASLPTVTKWESIRDLWIQRLLNLQIPTQFQKNERTN